MCREHAEIDGQGMRVGFVSTTNMPFYHSLIPAFRPELIAFFLTVDVVGDRASRVEGGCQRLRMLYRDCAKPPPPPCKSARKTSEVTWNISKLFPPVRSCLFTNGDCAITFLGDPSASSGLPRGTIVYASKPVQSLVCLSAVSRMPNYSVVVVRSSLSSVYLQAPSFYWEIEICSFGNSQEDNGSVVSFGFAPAAEKREGAWTNPVGTVLFHKYVIIIYRSCKWLWYLFSNSHIGI